MWVTRDKDGSLWVSRNKPVKNEEKGMWECVGNDYYEIEWAEGWSFCSVKWSDTVPTEIKLEKNKMICG